MESKIKISYMITVGNGSISGRDGRNSFRTVAEATEEAKAFKDNPRCHNPNMSEENVNYWKNEKFVIEKRITITEQIEVV